MPTTANTTSKLLYSVHENQRLNETAHTLIMYYYTTYVGYTTHHQLVQLSPAAFSLRQIPCGSCYHRVGSEWQAGQRLMSVYIAFPAIKKNVCLRVSNLLIHLFKALSYVLWTVLNIDHPSIMNGFIKWVEKELYLEAVSDNVLWSMWVVGRQNSGEFLFEFLFIEL